MPIFRDLAGTHLLREVSACGRLLRSKLSFKDLVHWLFFWNALLNKKNNLHDLLNPPRTQIEAFRRLPSRKKVQVLGWMCFIFLAIGCGVTFLSIPPNPSPLLHTIPMVGVVKSKPHPLRQNTSISSYLVRVDDYASGRPVSVRLYAMRGRCPSADLLVGEKVSLRVEALNPGYEVRDAVSAKGCHIYDDELDREIRAAINWSVYKNVYWFWSWALVSMLASIFFWCRSRPRD